MRSQLGFKSALIGLGAAAICGGVYYFFKRKRIVEEEINEEIKEVPITIEALKKIIQYTKYHYHPILESISKTVREAKEESRYNERFAEEMMQRSSVECNR